MRRRFNYPDRTSLSRMTNEDAQKIVHAVSVYEFPLLYDLSLKYAIFKVGFWYFGSHMLYSQLLVLRN
jgi:hypothetical protein